ncbi:MAG TPA: HEAT repeat domain-containing protein, partial [Vicinamibacteria bacterium]|nr:HEAT repeat domain-containing protein [Vicinamibacteria bacterium]
YIWDWHDKMDGGEFYTIRSEANGWPPWEEINADGLRDRRHAREQPEGWKRVAMLGDSVTLGDQVKPEEAYPQILEARLREAGRPIEVMNVGLWGWSTRQERIAYARIVRPYRPDAVLLAVCLNDIPELQNNLSRPPEWLAGLFRRSALVRRAVNAQGREIQSVEQLFTHGGSARVQEAMSRFFDEVRKLRDDVAGDGAAFGLLVFPFRFQVAPGAPAPTVQQSILEFCADEKLPCLDLLPILRPMGEPAFVDYDHLSAQGATAVAEALLGSDLLPKVGSHPEVLAASGADPAAAVSRLLLALEDREAAVRTAAAWALGRRADEADGRVLRALARSLRDDHEAVRAEAARALGVLGGAARPTAVPALFAALRDPREHVRWAAARALFTLGLRAPDDVFALAGLLAHPDPYVRGFAAFTLGEMGEAARAAVPALVAALEAEDGYGRGGASSALAKMGAAAAPAVPALVRGLESPDPDRRWKAARTLGRIGPPARDAVDRLARSLVSDADERVRSNAARALGRIDAARAAEVLQRAAKDADAGVRREAAEALARVGTVSE